MVLERQIVNIWDRTPQRLNSAMSVWSLGTDFFEKRRLEWNSCRVGVLLGLGYIYYFAGVLDLALEPLELLLPFFSRVLRRKLIGRQAVACTVNNGDIWHGHGNLCFSPPCCSSMLPFLTVLICSRVNEVDWMCKPDIFPGSDVAGILEILFETPLQLSSHQLCSVVG